MEAPKLINKIDYIVQWEGFRGQPYDDATGKRIIAPQGKVTILYGRNTDANPFKEAEGKLILEKDLERLEMQLILTFGFYKELTSNRQIAILDVCYNMGIGGFLMFKQCLKALYLKSYQVASIELKNSHYGRDPRSKKRCESNASLILNG